MGDGRWSKGQSGNPKGRPPNDEWAKWFAAAQWTAYCGLVRNARQGHNLPASNTASIYITDRNMGKPVATVEATVTHDLAHQHLLAVAEANGVPIHELQHDDSPVIEQFDPPDSADPEAHELPLFDARPPRQAKPGPELPELTDPAEPEE